ncbi:MAG: thermonuclease family protein [Glutamicibacter arilaitensis]|uniref:thermonuclease family protein n=1 Tax=Glutamicibacter arilaitensis TaxID=256701 RepID=UPI003FCF448E
MTKKAIGVSLLVAGAMAVGAMALTSSSASEHRGTVIQVIDGDTVDIMVSGAKTRIQLLNVATPQAKQPQRSAECLGPEAAGFLERTLPAGQKVTLEYDAQRTDHEGQTLAAVYKADQLINSEIAAQGFGIAIKFDPNTKFHEQVSQAQREAESAERGVFSTKIACTIPAQINDAMKAMHSVSVELGQTVEQADARAQQAAAAIAAGRAAADAMQAQDRKAQLISAVLAEDALAPALEDLAETIEQTADLEIQHEQQVATLSKKVNAGRKAAGKQSPTQLPEESKAEEPRPKKSQTNSPRKSKKQSQPENQPKRVNPNRKPVNDNPSEQRPVTQKPSREHLCSRVNPRADCEAPNGQSSKNC